MQKIFNGVIAFLVVILVIGVVSLPAAILLIGDSSKPIDNYEWRLLISWASFMVVLLLFLVARLYNAQVANSAHLHKLSTVVNKLDTDLKQSKPTWDRFLGSFPTLSTYLSSTITSLEELKAVLLLQIKELRTQKIDVNANQTPPKS